MAGRHDAGAGASLRRANAAIGPAVNRPGHHPGGARPAHGEPRQAGCAARDVSPA